MSDDVRQQILASNWLEDTEEYELHIVRQEVAGKGWLVSTLARTPHTPIKIRSCSQLERNQLVIVDYKSTTLQIFEYI